MNLPSVEPGAFPVSDQVVIQDRVVDDTQHGTAIFEQGDQRAEKVAARHKRLGAVDGIEHPLIARIGLIAAMFLAEDTVLRIGLHDHRAHDLFGLAISDGDRGLGLP